MNRSNEINLDEYESIESHWIALQANGDKLTYFDTLELNIFWKKLKKSIENKNIIKDIYRNLRRLLHWIYYFYVER